MKVKAVYLGRAVSRPGQQHATTATHFPAKAGFDLELDLETGWLTIGREGQARMVPPHNILWVVPFEKDDKDLPKAPAAKAAPAKGKPAQQDFADR